MRDDKEPREQLVLRVDEARAKLLHTVEQLDCRRREALDLGRQMRRHLGLLVIAGGVVLLATAGAIALVTRGINALGRQRRLDRWRIPKDLGLHRIRALRPRQRPLLNEVARSLLLPLLSVAVRHAVTLAASKRGPIAPASSV